MVADAWDFKGEMFAVFQLKTNAAVVRKHPFQFIAPSACGPFPVVRQRFFGRQCPMAATAMTRVVR
jgi:hypothetical protein